MSDESPTPEAKPDEIIEAVKKYNSPWKNTDYKRDEVTQVGRATIYTVTFMGQANTFGTSYPYTNYVLVRRSQEKPRVFTTLDELFNNLHQIVSEPWTNIEIIKIYTLVGVTIMLAASVLYILWLTGGKDSTALPLITTVLGSIVGYLIGDRTSRNF